MSDLIRSDENTAINRLLKDFPTRHSVLEIRGLLHRAFVTGQLQMGSVSELSGYELSAPVFVAVRPNPLRRQEMFVQALPPDYQALFVPCAA